MMIAAPNSADAQEICQNYNDYTGQSRQYCFQNNKEYDSSWQAKKNYQFRLFSDSRFKASIEGALVDIINDTYMTHEQQQFKDNDTIYGLQLTINFR